MSVPFGDSGMIGGCVDSGSARLGGGLESVNAEPTGGGGGSFWRGAELSVSPSSGAAGVELEGC